MAKTLHKVKPVSWSLLMPVWFIGVAVANCIIYFIMKVLNNLLVRPDFDTDKDAFAQRADFYGPSLIGVCEHILYPIALIKGIPEFIGVWLALKVAGQWKRWSPDDRDLTKADDGRRLFNKFLIGNALSIMFGFLIYIVLKIFVLNK
ncbi:MAG: hypothetical protein V1709_04265 [Planctomycetota bacterium]